MFTFLMHIYKGLQKSVHCPIYEQIKTEYLCFIWVFLIMETIKFYFHDRYGRMNIA